MSNLGFHSDLTTNDPMVFPDNVEKNEGKENSTFVFPGEETKRTGDKNSTVTFPEEDLKQEEKEEGLIVFLINKNTTFHLEVVFLFLSITSRHEICICLSFIMNLTKKLNI